MPSMRKPGDTRNRPGRRAAATNRPHTNAIDRTARAAGEKGREKRTNVGAKAKPRRDTR